MPIRVNTSQASAQTVEQLQDKLLGYPSKGVNVGGGRFVPMPAVWDGTGAVPPGWTSYKGCSFKHPVRAEWATVLDPALAAALADARASRLSAGEKTTLQNELAAAVATLPADWTP